MKEAKHTPGPWQVQQDVRDGWGYHIKDPNERFDVAVVPLYYDGRVEERAANVCLLAAAPDLLEALEGVLRVADRKTVEFDAARTAIAKATGSEAA